MKARDVLFELEKNAIEWGKQYQIARVGDIVTSNLGGKKTKKLRISSVSVTIGRNAKETVRKTLVLEYCGQRVKANGEFDGCGYILQEFTTFDGRKYEFSENEVTEIVNDCGLSFCIDFDNEHKEKYPDAYESYGNDCPFYSR